MVSTVTQSSAAVVGAAASNAGLAGALSLVTAVCFIIVLVTREMAASASGGWLWSLRRGASIAMYPLGLAFLLIIWNQLAQLG